MNTTNSINVGRSRLAKAAKSAAVLFVSCALLIAAMTAYSQVTVTMNTAPFDTAAVGYMSWTPNPADNPPTDGGYGSSGWGLSALPAVFSGSTLTLSPNVNVYDSPSDPYWVNPDGSGANIMDAAVYVEVGGGAYANEQVTFWYYVNANTLSGGYTADAFIKDFGPGYSYNGEVTGTMTPGWNSVVYTLTGNNAGEIVQYGFEVIGPDANPATVAAYGNVQIEDPPTGPNLLVDPDFASGTAVAGGIGGWTPFNGGAFSTDYAFGPTTYSMENSGGGGYSVPGSYQVLASTAGSAYLLTGYAYIPTALTGASEGFLQATFYDSEGDNLGTVQTSPGNALVSTPVINSSSPTGTWIEMQEIVTAPADTASIQVFTLVLDADPTTVYFDEMSLVSTTPPPPPPQPTSAAPTPSLPSDSVLAMYDSSGVYPEWPVEDWDASWSNPSGPGGEIDFTIPSTSSTVLEYPLLQFAGAEFYSAPMDVSSYNYMHFDVWTPGANQFAVQLVSLDASGPDSGTQAGQIDITPLSGVLTAQNWIGIDIPLSQFTAPGNQLDNATVDLTDLQQLLWVDNVTVGGGTTGGTFYIDNVYFYTRTVPGPFSCSIALVSGNVQISWPSALGISYTVVESPTLGSSANWTAIGSPVIGTGGTKTVSVPTPSTPMFFQVMQDY
ncbi:MAG: hypothetical protein ACLQU4_01735 [Limisphaerales bacterium]